MNLITRLEMETKGIELPQNEVIIYLQEVGLNPQDEYMPTSKKHQKGIVMASLSILESIANNPANMTNYIIDDMTVSQFSNNINSRIEHLTKKLRSMKTEETNTSIFMLWM